MAAASSSREHEPLDPLIAKLENVVSLSDGDRRALAALGDDIREFQARRSLIREGDRPEHVHLIVEGWAARYKLLADGRRQITAFLLPGDFCDLHVTLLGEMDHGIATLTRARVAFVSRATIEALADRPGLARAFWWTTLVDEAVLRAWIVNIGRRDAYAAVGHLICELYGRMANVGLVADLRFDLPLTQEEVADALGLTPVHVNRVLRRLRSEELISFRHGLLVIHDYARLERAAGFDPNYLHIERRVEPPSRA